MVGSVFFFFFFFFLSGGLGALAPPTPSSYVSFEILVQLEQIIAPASFVSVTEEMTASYNIPAAALHLVLEHELADG